MPSVKKGIRICRCRLPRRLRRCCYHRRCCWRRRCCCDQGQEGHGLAREKRYYICRRRRHPRRRCRKPLEVISFLLFGIEFNCVRVFLQGRAGEFTYLAHVHSNSA
jgi:hypothetical protein